MIASRLKMALAKWSFKRRRHEFYSYLAEAMEDRGVLVDILEKTQRRFAERNDVEAALFAFWLDRMEDHSFPDALRGTVPGMDVMILSAAQGAGNFTEGLKFLAMTVEASRKMKSAVLGAIAIPTLLCVLLLAYILLVAFWVEPMCASVLDPAKWPMLGRVLYYMAKIVTDYGMFLGTFVTGFVALVVCSMSRWAGKYRRIAEKIFPLYAIYRDYTGSIFLVALAALMQSGVGLAESLSELQKEAPQWLQWHIDEIMHRLDKESDQPAKAFNTGVFSQGVTDRVEDFGERSNFEEALSKVGLSSIDKIVQMVTVSARVMNVSLLITVAVFLAVIYGGAAMIIMSASDSIGTQTTAVTK